MGVLDIFCCITNWPKFSGLKQKISFAHDFVEGSS